MHIILYNKIIMIEEKRYVFLIFVIDFDNSKIFYLFVYFFHVDTQIDNLFIFWCVDNTISSFCAKCIFMTSYYFALLFFICISVTLYRWFSIVCDLITQLISIKIINIEYVEIWNQEKLNINFILCVKN